MTILITGVAGFIGFHLAHRLLGEQTTVIGIDNLNDYYDVNLKNDRLSRLSQKAKTNSSDFIFIRQDIVDFTSLDAVFAKYVPKIVIHLAAQAGVRYSIENPSAYIQSNLVGFANILECSRHHQIDNLIYASSSSVYGGNTNIPFSENQSVDHPVSLYAATKKSNELMAHAYSHLYKLPTTGLRFFTVYGPWGRPDMALFLFAKGIIENKPIKIFNNGQMIRDFTYVDDIIESVYRLIELPASADNSFNTNNPNSSSSWAPYRVFNIGNSNPTKLMIYIKALEDEFGRTAKKEFLGMQPGDVQATSADTSLLEKWIKFRPSTSIEEGIHKFVSWYKEYYNL